MHRNYEWSWSSVSVENSGWHAAPTTHSTPRADAFTRRSLEFRGKRKAIYWPDGAAAAFLPALPWHSFTNAERSAPVSFFSSACLLQALSDMCFAAGAAAGAVLPVLLSAANAAVVL